MAKWAIFTNNQIFKLAASDSVKDKFIEMGGENTTAKQINDTQWNDISWNQKIVALVNDSVSFTDIPVGDPDGLTDEERNIKQKEAVEQEIKNQIFSIEQFLEVNTDADWTAYLNNLKSIDVSSITFPIDNFQKWFNSQSGFSSKSILELP